MSSRQVIVDVIDDPQIAGGDYGLRVTMTNATPQGGPGQLHVIVGQDGDIDTYVKQMTRAFATLTLPKPSMDALSDDVDILVNTMEAYVKRREQLENEYRPLLATALREAIA